MTTPNRGLDPSLHAARGYNGWTPAPPRSQDQFLEKVEGEYGIGHWGEILQSTFLHLMPVIAIGSLGARFGRNPSTRLLFDELASSLFTGYFRSEQSKEGYGEASLKDFGEGVIARTVLNQAVSLASGGIINPHLTRFVLMPALMAVGGWVAESAIEKNKKFSDAVSGGFGWELGYRWIGAFSMMNIQSNLLRSPKLFGFKGSFHADDWIHPDPTPVPPAPPPPAQPTAPVRRPIGFSIGGNIGRAFAALARPRPVEIKTIADIHGEHFATPHRGAKINGLRGVVTAVARSGFWIQEPSRTGDGSFNGIFVYTKDPPSVRAGDLLNVSGEVSVFSPPGGRELSQTQIGRATYSAIGRGALPEPVLIGEGGRLPPETLFKRDGTSAVDLEDRKTPFRPDQDAIAFYTTLNDQRVRVSNARVVGVSSRSSQCAVAIDGGKHLRYRTPDGLPILMPGGPNTDVLTLDFKLLPREQKPKLGPEDRIVGDLVGVLDYSYGQFRILVTEPIQIEKNPLQRQTVTTLVGDDEHFTVADSNFENFFPKDSNPKRTEELAEIILKNMKNPDVIALQEGMDNSGAKDDGVVKASYELLNDEIRKLGGQEYQYVEVAPKNNDDGGKPGGNIRVAYLVRTDRLSLKLHDGGDFDDPAALEMRDGQLHLQQNPARVDPKNPAYDGSRKPLVIQYRFNDIPVIQVNMHPTSRRGDDPLWGRYQPPAENSGKKREEQHTPVAAFWESARRLDPDAAFIAGGDLNAYAWERSVRILTDAGLVDLAEAKLPPGANYTYWYDGAASYHSFDHLLSSPSLARDAEIEILHLNSGLHEQFSDHDIKIARFRVPRRV